MWKRLETFFKHDAVKMTKAKYLDMCRQLGVPPKDEEIPPDWDDLPDICHDAMNIFNQLGDRIYPEIGYVGKDYTNLPILVQIYGIENIELLLELLNWYDSKAIKESSKKLKAEYDRMKRQNRGPKRN